MSLPCIFNDCLKWDILDWNFSKIIDLINSDDIRLGYLDLNSDDILWENRCQYTADKTIFDKSPHYSKEKIYFAYYGYKHIKFLKCKILNEIINWSFLGFDDRKGNDSTIWIGTLGSYTPCHYDTYGFNLVAQIYGKKLWILFPPSDTHHLNPTRIPYEESSVFCLKNPFFLQNTSKLHPISCILTPGQVLYIPRHWWHLVLTLTEKSVSVNTWIPQMEDISERINEARIRILINSIMTQIDESGSTWINSYGEKPSSIQENLTLYEDAKELQPNILQNNIPNTEMFWEILKKSKCNNLQQFHSIEDFNNYLDEITFKYFNQKIDRHVKKSTESLPLLFQNAQNVVNEIIFNKIYSNCE